MADKAYQLGVDLTIGEPVDVSVADMPAGTCNVYWASHGCYLPKGHAGDKLSHVCEPCPGDCPGAYQDEDWQTWEGWNNWQHCTIHCNMRPSREYMDKQYGDDVHLYPDPPTGVPSHE